MTGKPLDRIGRRAGFAACALLLGCLSGALAVEAAAREEAPARKAHRAQPARTSQSAPDRTGSIGRTAAPPAAVEAARPAPAAAVEDEASLVPVTLPNVPRSRMIACGEHWQAMKMNGTTGDDCWRDYAMKCLIAKDAPAP